MQFTNTFLTLAALLPAAFAAGACPKPPNGSIPYHVTGYFAFYPSGHPGNSLIITNDLNFTDPNTCSRFACHYEYERSNTVDSPFKKFVPCAGITGVEFFCPDNAGTFTIRHKFNTNNQQGDTLTWTVTANGTVPYRRNCGGSGVCSDAMPEGVTADLKITEITVIA